MLHLQEFCNVLVEGSHTGQRILDCYHSIIDSYQLDGKVSYVVTDNASNMKAAFNLQLFDQDVENSSDEDELWKDSCDDSSVDLITTERLSCFAHSLQLVVKDGMKELKPINAAMGKASRITTLLHSSIIVKVGSTVKLYAIIVGYYMYMYETKLIQLLVD